MSASEKGDPSSRLDAVVEEARRRVKFFQAGATRQQIQDRSLEGDLARDLGLTGGPPTVGGLPRPSILTINGGSSGLKFAVFATAGPIERVLSGRVERVGLGGDRADRGDRGAVPGVPQVACFDTAFHRALPRTAQILGVPSSYVPISFESTVLNP